MDKEFAIDNNNFNHTSYNELYRKKNYDYKLKQEKKNAKKKINN